MLKLPTRFGLSGMVLTILLTLASGLARAADPTVTFDVTMGPPPATASFDISFVKNDIGAYVLADRTNNAVDLFNASKLMFSGGIGSLGFVGPGPAVCAVAHACAGPNGVLIDNDNNVWAGDGPASACTTPDCACFSGETTSMVKEYRLATSTGATGRLACLDTGGKFRADEMAFDPRDNLLIVANDADGFLSLIKTSGKPSIVDKFFYADNDVGKSATISGLATPGGGIEQPVWDPQQGFFYLALPQGTAAGRVDIFNPKPGKLVLTRSFDVPGCTGGPSGLALNNAEELLGACSNGVALIDANNGKVSILGTAATVGGADEIWFDPGSNAWYVSHSTGGQLGVVSNNPDHTIQVVTQPGCCGHSVAVFSAGGDNEDDNGHGHGHGHGHHGGGDGNNQSFVFAPTATGSGIGVFKATTP